MNKTVTQEQIDSVIESEEYVQVGKKTTIGIITLKNGFEVIGVSACVDPANYDHAIGTEYARKRAIDKIWELEGYLLQNNNF